MIITTLAIGDRRFRLAQNVDVSRLEDQLLDAMRAGGGVVPIPAAGLSSVRAIVTPGLPVLVETAEEPESSMPNLEDDVSYDNYLSDYLQDL
ncbi:hypothetical protein [Mycetocola zhadangensis]|uniref:Uncharacterized protein n=1 Tax=Mycetocola zhadangensis TaxID=1164595 RepID=A0A3L7IX28_9MICO|nr:hypothetical protein [Mycetocola zhadangensis]RLQ82659.1 hypothetical protein D9V28_11940 [Mycetocola zhadangensis]GGE99330.1 hypothetical protein GCM10011313_22860 [Mycetocola zhadangensis]